MAAAVFASLVFFERKSYGTFFAVLWMTVTIMACLALGTNTLN
jgi:hypothetical protein